MDKKNIVDFYPLSPMQQGMLFHSLLAPESGMYVEQMSCTLQGGLDIPAFREAWQFIVDRHMILRTAFIGEGLKEPIQVVHRRVQLPFEILDWRSVSPAEYDGKLETFLADDRARGFTLAKPPLMRLYMIRRADQGYEFIWTHHHILLDGWSIPLIFQEVLAAYEALRHGKEPHLPPAIPYRDYIRWLKQQDIQTARDFWQDYLKGFTTPTSLVVDRRRQTGVEISGDYDERERWLPEELSSRLQRFARAQKITLSTLVQSAWSYLLGYYNDSDDVVFGATTSGRPASLPGSETMVGLFINTLPVRVRLSAGQSVSQWLQSLQKQLAEVRQYEFTPLVQIQSWSDVPPGRPLFESLLVFENYPATRTLQGDLGSLEISGIRSFEKTNYPLTVVAGMAGELMLKIIFERGTFTSESIETMLGNLETILKGFLERPDKVLVGVPILTDEEAQKLIYAWNATQTDYPQDRCVHQLFEAQAAARPDAIALTHGNLSLTYDELNRRANQLAHHLKELGVGPEVITGICLPRSIEMIIAALAVLKAGGAYLPMDADNPAERLAFMLADAHAPVLLSQRSLQDALPVSQVNVIWLDDAWEALSTYNQHDPVCEVNLTNLAYVIYTSGSTGKPKGVQIEHKGLLNLVYWHQRAFSISADDRATQIAGPGFDAVVWEVWPYLACGASLHIVDDETRASPWLLRDWLVDQRITVSFLPTPLAETVLELAWPEDAPLRYLLTGGDQLHTFPPPGLPFQLVNNYGPTESTVVSTSGVVPPREAPDELPDIGRPIDNYQVYLLDSQMRPVPVGVPGELHIGGAGLARGYINRPDLSSKAFVANPVDLAHSKRIYKTGDLARYTPDGRLEFLGRIDTQVKLRGFRIELGEIENVLNQHPDVKQSVVIAREDQPGDRYLAAYIVSTEGASLDIDALNLYLAKKLPVYMLPSIYVPLDALPLNRSGKVDRRALPAPQGDVSRRKSEYIAPRNPLERRLTSLWESILGKKPIGIKDDFFALGGHSMLAVRVMGQLQQQYGITVPLVTIFKHPTIEHLANVISEQDGAVPLSLLVPLHADGSRPPLFFIHPSGGSVHWYLELSMSLGEDQPFYGIQARGLHGESELHTEITPMAAYYVKAIRDFQPQGPYLLGSWSMGVIIAYEVARQLTEMGAEVAFLGLLDQGPDLPIEEPEDQAAYLVDVFGKQLPLSLDHLRELTEQAQIEYVWQEAKKANFVFPEITLEQFENFIHMLSTHTEAWRRYKPEPFPGKISLFRAQEQPANTPPERDMGWGRLALGGVDVIDVPGNHLTMIHSPNLQVLAQKMRTCLEGIQSTAGEGDASEPVPSNQSKPIRET